MLIEIIKTAWGWTGIRPSEVVCGNPFGNVIVKDEGGAYWRICPEELQCEIVAANDSDLENLFSNEDFILDWEVEKFVEVARAHLGELPENRKYCLKIPGPLGGKYAPENFGTINWLEQIAVSGDVAEQIKDLPDGAQIKIKVVD